MITRNELKEILQITDNTKDTLIDRLIPLVTAFIKRYTNNDYLDNKVTVTSSAVSFTATQTITDTSDWVDSYFTTGMTIQVSGSINNDGLYTISNVTNTILTTTETTITTEDFDQEITITRVKYPAEIKLIIASMIGESIEYGERQPGVTQERLGDYSYTYATTAQYSDNVLKMLYPFKIVRTY